MSDHATRDANRSISPATAPALHTTAPERHAKRSKGDLDLFDYDDAMPATIDMPPALADIPPLPSVEGGFKTVLADPPWRFANQTGKVAPEHRRLDRYDTMDLEEIKALPVSDVTAKDAHLYLWVPKPSSAHLRS